MDSFSSDKLSRTSFDSSYLSNGVSPKKCNLSFSINFGAESEVSSDSETADLQIDVSEIDNYERPRKRSRIEIEDISKLNEMEEEIERQLDAKAEKTNLTVTNVKNILRSVITDEHVLAMVHNRIHNTDEGTIFEPKLTRAKAKELAMAQPNIPWPMTPGKKPIPSEVQALIENDLLLEDSSDEEYNPEHDQQSEDEGDNLTNSDIDSQPPTPASNAEVNLSVDSTVTCEVNFDTDGIFKIPDIPNVQTDDENIGQRTRSKVCLVKTPLETIVEQFRPPDIPADMYDVNPEPDEVWSEFLKEYTQPLTEHNVEDDPEADPEYNFLEDPEFDFLDKEELRVDKAVKVPRRELNDLVAGMIEFKDIYEGPKKKKSPDTSVLSVSNNSMTNSMVDLLPVLAEPELPKAVSYDHSNLISVQLQQHVQLMTQHFVMTYMHPQFHNQSKLCKDNLNSLNILQTGENCHFSVANLPAAMKLVEDWEGKFKDLKFKENYIDMMNEEGRIARDHAKRKTKYIGQFHPELSKLIMRSKALIFPELLPHVPFIEDCVNRSRAPYLRSEDYLIALGLEGFIPFLELKLRLFRKKKTLIIDAAALICQYLTPVKEPSKLYRYITSRRCPTAPENPIKHYFQTGFVPSVIHCISLEYDMKAPKDQHRSCLPKIWQEYFTNRSKEKMNMKKLENVARDLASSTFNMSIDESLRNPTINMLPSISHLSQTSEKEIDTIDIKEEIIDMNIDSSVQITNSPPLRKTTPRLAKIRSAQNMKLMTQVSSPKNLCSSIKTRGKEDSSKNSEDSCGSSKGDNEDEIAELMLASTTIKKDTANRKKARQARELENIKRLLEAENEMGKEDRATKFAASYIQKLHMTLESSNPETLKAVIKLYLDYSENIEKLNQMTQDAQDNLTIRLYKDICETLHEYPELCSDFLLFLKPHQAAMINKSADHTMLSKMTEFINVAQIYFAKQPSRMARVMQAITHLAADPLSLENVFATMDPVLKGHPLVMDMFQQVFPTGKPPESLLEPNLFENLTYPVGPYDKHRIYTEDSPELYENIELSTPAYHEDNYGGDNCKCDCHDTAEFPQKTGNSEHCISCGVRYLNGRIYLQTSEGLRPAKITFPGDEEEKLENIARVSTKTIERFLPATSTGRRRKSSKNDLVTEESVQKQCPSKSSPIKDCEDIDKIGSKAKRGAKSPPKSIDQRRLSKSSEVGTSSTISIQSTSSEPPTSPIKSKREKRAERREAKSESKNLTTDLIKFNEQSSPIFSDHEEPANKSDQCDMSLDTSKILGSSDSDLNQSSEPMEISSKSDSDTTGESEETMHCRPWTRQEDMLLLQNIQKDYSDSTFAMVSETLCDRTFEQVKERCEKLLSMLQKMV